MRTWSSAVTEFVYTIKSHPTSYKGVNFRSRLEATWAAFFDLCGWEWEYEPVDLPGWTPDFILEKKIAVEVKPVREMLPNVSRFVRSGWPNGMLLLGVSPSDPDHSYIGWCMGDVEWSLSNSKKHGLGPGANGELILMWDDGLANMDYETDGSYGRFYEANRLWNEAKNTVQWMPVR